VYLVHGGSTPLLGTSLRRRLPFEAASPSRVNNCGLDQLRLAGHISHFSFRKRKVCTKEKEAVLIFLARPPKPCEGGKRFYEKLTIEL
jgi:hypothetical protein